MDEKKAFVKLWLSYSAYFEAYSAAEVGRLVRAMMEYKSSGAEPEFSGNERFIWPAIRRDIDMANEIEQSKALQNRRNGKSGGRPKKSAETQENPLGFTETQPNPENPDGFSENPKNPVGFTETQPNPEKAMEKEKVKVKEKVSNTPLPPSAAETGFGPELQSAFEDWLQYKIERREPYKPTGLRYLVSQLRNKAAKYGESNVADLIRQCMSSNWKGIIYDKLDEEHSAHSRGSPGQRDWAELADEMAAGMGDGSS